MGKLVTLGWRKGLVMKAKGSRDLCRVPGMNQGRVLKNTFGFSFSQGVFELVPTAVGLANNYYFKKIKALVLGTACYSQLCGFSYDF